MAIVRLGTEARDAYFIGDLKLHVAKNGRSAIWDFEAGGSIAFSGSNLKEGKHELLSGGSVKSVILYNPNGDMLETVSGLDIKASKLMKAFDKDGPSGVQNLLLAGNDKVVGTGHSDYVAGGAGNDVLTGGGDADAFVFTTTTMVQHDIITDFSLYQDWLDLDSEIETTQARHKGYDTLATLENGSTILFEDVAKADFDEWLSTR